MAADKKANGKAAEEAPAKKTNGEGATNDDQQQEAKPAVEIARLSGGKPDPEHNKAQLDEISKQIEKVQAEVNNVRSILSGEGPSKDTPAGKRRAELRAQLDEIRGKQAGSKGARGKVLDEVKTLQEGLTKKINDLKASKSKLKYGSTAEVDAKIKQLEKQVESGTMKIVEERKTLTEISTLRKTRKVVEGFDAQQSVIDADKAKIDELRKGLDDPESREMSKKYDAIRTELDAITKEFEKQAGSRSKLLDQRTALSAKLDALYSQKRERHAAFKAANDAYYKKIQDERQKREERYREERKAVEEQKRKEQERQMREDAALPAFAKEIEDCSVLINYFSGNKGASSSAAASAQEGSANGKVLGKKLELRSVEEEAPKGAVVARKKGEDNDENSYFVAAPKTPKGKGKKNKRGTPLNLNDDSADASESGASTPATGEKLNVPLGHLTALLSLSIPPPVNTADVPRVVDNLKLKREYFISNQDRQTKENIEKVEKLLAKSKLDDEAAPAEAATAKAE